MLGNKNKKVFVSLNYRSSNPEVFLGKGILIICSKFTGEHPWRSVISIKLLCSFIEITLQHECSPVNLLHIFRTPFPRNRPGQLLLKLHWILFYFSFCSYCMHFHLSFCFVNRYFQGNYEFYKTIKYLCNNCKDKKV